MDCLVLRAVLFLTCLLTSFVGCKHIESSLSLSKEFQGGEKVEIVVKISE